MKRKSKAHLTAALVLSSLLGVGSAFANSTDVLINATMTEYVILQVEQTSDGEIVSADDIDPSVGSPTSNLELDFGSVDPFGGGVNTTATVNNGSAPTLRKRLLVGGVFEDISTYTGTSFASTDGAIYYVDGAYRLFAMRNDGEPDMDVDVNVTGTDALPAFVDVGGAAFADGETMNASAVREPGAGDSTLTTISDAGDGDGNSVDIDMGVIVRRNEPAGTGTKDTLITFTGI